MKTSLVLLAFMLLAGLKSTAQIQSQPNKEDRINSTHPLFAQVLKKHHPPKRNYNEWHPNPIYVVKDSLTKPKFQCWGTTKSGGRCKHLVKCDHCFCSQHEKQKLPEVD